MSPEKTRKDRWARLASMGSDELLDRGRQYASARADALRQRLGLRFPIQVRDPGSQSPPQFFFASADISSICHLLEQRFPRETADIVQRAERICQHRFDLLGYEDLDYGRDIDWHCDRVHAKRAPRKSFHRVRFLDFAEAGDVKITWELNRHQHFVTLAKAYRLTGDEKFAVEIFRQWKHWHTENPYPVGVNWASTLEVAFRSLSWLWTYFLLADCLVAPHEFHREWLESLGISGRHIERYLSTYFSPNTHLLGEGVALFFIGTLCPELRSAQRWKRRGWEIVLQEAHRQVAADGMHFEQSIYYHVYALDLFLHARILASLNGTVIPPGFDRTTEKMLEALCWLGRAGVPPRFGDDDGGRLFNPQRNRTEHMLDPLATGAVLFGRGDFKEVAGGIREETVWLLVSKGVAVFDNLVSTEPPSISVGLGVSGLYLMAEAGAQRQLVIDAGPQGAATAGHGHADALSICANSNGRALLVDPGTYEYVGNSFERDEFRGTASHNTMRVDGKDQADPKAPFAWANLSKTRSDLWITGERFDLFTGTHEGYSRLPEPVVHRRWVFSLKSHFWLVRDLAAGTGQHYLDLFWHLAPDLVPRGSADLVFDFPDQRNGFSLLTTEGNGWNCEILHKVWSPAYGRKEPSTVARFRTVATLPAEFVTLLLPTQGSAANLGKLEKMKSTHASVSGYRYEAPDQEHYFLFAASGRAWSLGPWTSDAEFVYFGTNPGGVRTLIFCNGSFVESGGQRVVSCTRAIERCELVETNGRTELFSSDSKSVRETLPLDGITAECEAAPVASSVPVSSVPGSGQTGV